VVRREGSSLRVTAGGRRRLLVKDAGAKRTVSVVETIGVTRHVSERIFDVGFWMECELEAAEMLRMITGVDDDH
jgi:hypothetical protein